MCMGVGAYDPTCVGVTGQPTVLGCLLPRVGSWDYLLFCQHCVSYYVCVRFVRINVPKEHGSVFFCCSRQEPECKEVSCAGNGEKIHSLLASVEHAGTTSSQTNFL